MAREKTRCRDCGVEAGQLHKKGCGWEICSKCGVQLLMCNCINEEESKRIPYGTVREIAARIPHFTCDHIEKYVKKDILSAIESGLW